MLLKSIVTVLLLSSLAPTAFAKVQGDPWKDTKVDFTLVEDFAKNIYPCNKTEQYQLACMELVTGMGSFLSPVQMIIAKGSEGDLAGAKITVLQDMGPIQLVQVDWTGVTLAPAAADGMYKKHLLSLVPAAKEFFHQQPNFDFVELTRKIFAQVKPNEAYSTQAVLVEAVGRLMVAVDGHSHLDATEAMRAQNSNADHNWVGIGAEVTSAPKGTLIANVFEGSAAEKFGVHDGDVITQVDDFATVGADLDKVVQHIVGTAGTTVHLKIDRQGKTLELGVVRAAFSVKNVDLKIVEDVPGVKIAHIKLKSFEDDHACEKIDAILRSLPPYEAVSATANDVRGVVLDLRHNPGGALEQAICIGGLFVGQHPIVKVRDVKDGVTQPDAQTYPSDQDMVTELPTVVLIDNMSASASEIVSGALQDYQRAFVMGTTSFGKATVQEGHPYHLFDGQVYWFQTIQRFYQPRDHTNQQVGIQPDFQVYPRPNMTAEEKVQPREGDLVPTALSATGKTWVQPRGEEISRLQNTCMNAKRADSIYASYVGQRPGAKNDYQLYSAEELLACEVGPTAAKP